ncbi:MAG TPA: ferrochelatase [Actinomycetota bacterium]|nr:ferrochelatase [Actinomycetota bacterium]
MTTAVLCMAYGGPRALDEVEDYYTDIRGGRRPSPEALADLLRRYEAIGGLSPLPEITRRQAEALQVALDGAAPGRFRTYVGMKHWHPFVGEAVDGIVAEGPNEVGEVIGLVLAPHFSKMSIGGYEQRLLAAQAATGATFAVDMIPYWYDDPGFVTFAAENLRAALGDWDPADPGTRVFFSAHSLPERILAEGDPYKKQLLESSGLIAAAAGVPNWEFAFQSQSHTGEPWLGPDVLTSLETFAAAGGTRAVVAPIGFVADHLEVLFDIDVECVDQAAELGIELRRTASPNDDPRFIQVLAGVVLKRAAGTS